MTKLGDLLKDLFVCDECRMVFNNLKDSHETPQGDLLCPSCADEYFDDMGNYFETQLALEESGQYDYE